MKSANSKNINPMTETAYFSHAAMHAGNSQNLNISTNQFCVQTTVFD